MDSTFVFLLFPLLFTFTLLTLLKLFSSIFHHYYRYHCNYYYLFYCVFFSIVYYSVSLSLSAAMDLGGHLFTFIYLTFIFIFIFTFVDASFISVKKSDNFFEQYFDFWLSLINQTADDIHTNINEQNNISAKCKNDVIYFIDSAQNRSSWALKSKCFVFNFFVLLFLTGLYIIIMFFYYINILILRSK